MEEKTELKAKCLELDELYDIKDRLCSEVDSAVFESTGCGYIAHMYKEMEEKKWDRKIIKVQHDIIKLQQKRMFDI